VFTGALPRLNDGATTRRHDVKTAGAFGALHSKATKLTKTHKENLVSLFYGLQPLPPPRFARWQE